MKRLNSQQIRTTRGPTHPGVMPALAVIFCLAWPASMSAQISASKPEMVKGASSLTTEKQTEWRVYFVNNGSYDIKADVIHTNSTALGLAQTTSVTVLERRIFKPGVPIPAQRIQTPGRTAPTFKYNIYNSQGGSTPQDPVQGAGQGAGLWDWNKGGFVTQDTAKPPVAPVTAAEAPALIWGQWSYDSQFGEVIKNIYVIQAGPNRFSPQRLPATRERALKMAGELEAVLSQWRKTLLSDPSNIRLKNAILYLESSISFLRGEAGTAQRLMGSQGR